ncbi:MAG: LysR family transcriptional regulator [Burkholderiaceae bacterium]
MRSLNLDQLKTLATIAELGSFAAAARHLHLAAPTVSLHIAELEARLKVRLLHRERHRVVATGIGATVVESARRLLADAERLLDDVGRLREGRAGRVRIGASTAVLATLLPQAIATLRGAAPDIDVDVAVQTSQESSDRLLAGTLDIALVALPRSMPAGLQVHEWRRDPIMAFVPEQWAPPRIVTPRWLAARALILNDPGTHLHRITNEWFAAAGELARARIEINFNDAARSLVGAGYGAALLPVEAGHGTDDARIRVRPLRPALWRQLGIAHRRGPLEPAVECMFATLLGLSAAHARPRRRASAKR